MGRFVNCSESYRVDQCALVVSKYTATKQCRGLEMRCPNFEDTNLVTPTNHEPH